MKDQATPIQERASEDLDQMLLNQMEELVHPFIQDVPENEQLLKNPDDPMEHQPNWHQFGIITHTRKFAEYYKTEAQEYFVEWGVSEYVDSVLSQDIDGKTKKELLLISIPFHDLGKFARGFKEKDGKKVPNYTGHESLSEQLLMEDESLRDKLHDYGLTDDQIEYVAKCAGFHYELGKVRNTAKKSELGYTISYAESDMHRQASIGIAEVYPEFKVEIGVLFLCDSLAKTSVRIDAKTDDDIEGQTEYIEKEIDKQDLNSKLIAAIKQRPVNIAVAGNYLKAISE